MAKRSLVIKKDCALDMEPEIKAWMGRVFTNSRKTTAGTISAQDLAERACDAFCEKNGWSRDEELPYLLQMAKEAIADTGKAARPRLKKAGGAEDEDIRQWMRSQLKYSTSPEVLATWALQRYGLKASEKARMAELATGVQRPQESPPLPDFDGNKVGNDSDPAASLKLRTQRADIKSPAPIGKAAGAVALKRESPYGGTEFPVPHDSSWFELSEKFGMDLAELDEFANCMNFENFDDLDENATPEALFRDDKTFTENFCEVTGASAAEVQEFFHKEGSDASKPRVGPTAADRANPLRHPKQNLPGEVFLNAAGSEVRKDIDLFGRYLSSKPANWGEINSKDYSKLTDSQKAALQDLPTIELRGNPWSMVNDLPEKLIGTHGGKFYYVETGGYNYPRYLLHILNYEQANKPAAPAPKGEERYGGASELYGAAARSPLEKAMRASLRQSLLAGRPLRKAVLLALEAAGDQIRPGQEQQMAKRALGWAEQIAAARLAKHDDFGETRDYPGEPYAAGSVEGDHRPYQEAGNGERWLDERDAKELEPKAKRLMRASLQGGGEDFFDSAGEVNETALAEAVADELGHNPADGSSIPGDFFDWAVEVSKEYEEANNGEEEDLEDAAPAKLRKARPRLKKGRIFDEPNDDLGESEYGPGDDDEDMGYLLSNVNESMEEMAFENPDMEESQLISEVMAMYPQVEKPKKWWAELAADARANANPEEEPAEEDEAADQLDRAQAAHTRSQKAAPARLRKATWKAHSTNGDENVYYADLPGNFHGIVSKVGIVTGGGWKYDIQDERNRSRASLSGIDTAGKAKLLAEEKANELLNAMKPENWGPGSRGYGDRRAAGRAPRERPSIADAAPARMRKAGSREADIAGKDERYYDKNPHLAPGSEALSGTGRMRHPIEKCPNCKRPVYFDDPLWNECERCHRWYNGAGQEVRSPDSHRQVASDDFDDDNYSDGMWAAKAPLRKIESLPVTDPSFIDAWARDQVDFRSDWTEEPVTELLYYLQDGSAEAAGIPADKCQAAVKNLQAWLRNIEGNAAQDKRWKRRPEEKLSDYQERLEYGDGKAARPAASRRGLRKLSPEQITYLREKAKQVSGGDVDEKTPWSELPDQITSQYDLDDVEDWEESYKAICIYLKDGKECWYNLDEDGNWFFAKKAAARAGLRKRTPAARPDVSPADKARAKREYGNVRYADPKNKKYPIDSERHVRAAMSYIGQAKNAAKYSPAEVAGIKRRIAAAGKKYGVEFESGKVTASQVRKSDDYDDDDEEGGNGLNVKVGDYVDFGPYGQLYVNSLSGGGSRNPWRATDLEEERANPDAPGWNISPEMADSIIERYADVEQPEEEEEDEQEDFPSSLEAEALEKLGNWMSRHLDEYKGQPEKALKAFLRGRPGYSVKELQGVLLRNIRYEMTAAQGEKAARPRLTKAAPAPAALAANLFGEQAIPDYPDAAEIAAQVSEQLKPHLEAAAMKDAIIGDLQKRLSNLEGQPTPGGPILRPKETTAASTNAAQEAYDRMEKEVMRLVGLANTEPNPTLKADYIQKEADARQKLAEFAAKNGLQ